MPGTPIGDRPLAAARWVAALIALILARSAANRVLFCHSGWKAKLELSAFLHPIC
jgi:hypothetical protein